jgi:hypothetical protein
MQDAFRRSLMFVRRPDFHELLVVAVQGPPRISLHSVWSNKWVQSSWRETSDLSHLSPPPFVHPSAPLWLLAVAPFGPDLALYLPVNMVGSPFQGRFCSLC